MQKTEVTKNADGTRRSLSNRNVQMIAIGGTIGTGLFLGSGTTISKTGPSILLVYLVLGIFFFLMMRALGEMLIPTHHNTRLLPLLPAIWDQQSATSLVGPIGWAFLFVPWLKLLPSLHTSSFGFQLFHRGLSNWCSWAPWPALI